MKKSRIKNTKKPPHFLIINDIDRNMSKKLFEKLRLNPFVEDYIKKERAKPKIVNEYQLIKKTISKVKRKRKKFDRVLLLTSGGLMFAEEVAKQELAPKDRINAIDTSTHARFSGIENQRRKRIEMISRLKNGEKILLLDEMIGNKVGIDRLVKLKEEIEEHIGRGNVTMATGVLKTPFSSKQKIADNIIHAYECKFGERASERIEMEAYADPKRNKELQKALNRKRTKQGMIQL